PLSQFVSGTRLLKRRLDQIGLVEGDAGAALMAQLKPGERLVSREGALWRWDGFVAKADAPTQAAQRLAQRNRLSDLDAEIAALRRARETARENLAALRLQLDAARQTEIARRNEWREAQRSI